MLNTPVLDFQQVHAEYRPRILRYLVRLIGVEEAEDLTQEVFLRAERGLDTFRGEAQLSTWLYRIATNLAIDRLRKASFRSDREAVCLDEQCESAKGLEIWSGEAPVSLEQAVFEQERLDCFLRFAGQLPLSYRVVVLLSEIEARTTREISDILGLRPEAVKMRLHRGRARLFQALREHCQPEEWL